MGSSRQPEQESAGKSSKRRAVAPLGDRFGGKPKIADARASPAVGRYRPLPVLIAVYELYTYTIISSTAAGITRKIRVAGVVVGGGLEPSTSWMWAKRSNQLS